MLKMINALADRLFRANQLSALELVILNSIREKLKPEHIILWDKQLSVINKLHRSPDGKELNMYALSSGKVNFPPEFCFENREEFKIAVVDLEDNGGVHKLRARVWCVNGHVFSIEYKTSFKEFKKNTNGDWRVHCHIENEPKTAEIGGGGV